MDERAVAVHPGIVVLRFLTSDRPSSAHYVHGPDVRFMNHHLLDFGLTKNFRFGGRARMQVRIEALNATNYTLFGVGNVNLASNNASFMRLSNIDSSTVMKPRDVQIGATISF